MIKAVTLHLVNNPPRAGQVACDRSGTVAAIASFMRAAAYTILLLLTISLCGCANTEITAAQEELTKGDYVAAHEKFVAASHSPKLTAGERRELADGLCLTETNIGPPQYPLAEQRRRCANAAAQAGSSSGPVLARIDSVERDATKAEVHGALESDDIAGAQSAPHGATILEWGKAPSAYAFTPMVVRYQSFPGADQQAIAEWSKEIWSALQQQEGRTKHDRHLGPAIAAVSQRYPRMRAMNDIAFKRWVMVNATVASTPLVDSIDLHRGTIDLRVVSASLPDVAFNLDRFTRINDGMVARCRCDGHTNIAIEGSGLPAYLLRLDPETRRSEVLVMP
jgi:hypothetical protein